MLTGFWPMQRTSADPQGRDRSLFIRIDAQLGVTIVLKNVSIAAIGAMMIVSFKHLALGTSIGVGNPYPVSNYKCQGGTRLSVRLRGDRASVSVNDAAELDLPSKGPEGTRYSNGQWTLTIIQGRLSLDVGRAVLSLCIGVERLTSGKLKRLFSSVAHVIAAFEIPDTRRLLVQSSVSERLRLAAASGSRNDTHANLHLSNQR